MMIPDSGPLFCGPSGWAHAQWNGLFYPNSKSKDFHQLEFLSRFFNTVELSASFYQPLRPELSQLWARQVRRNPDFRFTARLWKKFSWERQIDSKDVAVFRDGLKPLEDAGVLGALLMQFPANFRFTAENRTFLIALRRAFRGLPLVAELRHSTWMEEDALATLIDYHIGFCNIDQPDHSRAMPPTAFLTSSVGYVRLCGRDAAAPYQYSEEELSEWVHRVRKVHRYSKNTFVVFGNDSGAKSLVNSFQMKHLLGMNEVRAPRELLSRFPRELNRVRPDMPMQVGLFGEKAA
jgi:uncharacterized protein YecE (DUF72 family)